MKDDVNKPMDFSSAAGQSSSDETSPPQKAPQAKKVRNSSGSVSILPSCWLTACLPFQLPASASAPLRSKTNEPRDLKRSLKNTGSLETEKEVPTKKGRPGKAGAASETSVSSSCDEVAAASAGKKPSKATRKRHPALLELSSTSESQEVSSDEADDDTDYAPTPNGSKAKPSSKRAGKRSGAASKRGGSAAAKVSKKQSASGRKVASRKTTPET